MAQSAGFLPATIQQPLQWNNSTSFWQLENILCKDRLFKISCSFKGIGMCVENIFEFGRVTSSHGNRDRHLMVFGNFSNRFITPFHPFDSMPVCPILSVFNIPHPPDTK